MIQMNWKARLLGAVLTGIISFGFLEIYPHLTSALRLF